MSLTVTNVAMKAYQDALQTKKTLERQIKSSMKPESAPDNGFGTMLTNSLGQVNQLEGQKNTMIEEFASGKTENVHELMIALQKAGVAMSLTGAVRSKVLTAYQELMRMSF